MKGGDGSPGFAERSRFCALHGREGGGGGTVIEMSDLVAACLFGLVEGLIGLIDQGGGVGGGGAGGGDSQARGHLRCGQGRQAMADRSRSATSRASAASVAGNSTTNSSPP